MKDFIFLMHDDAPGHGLDWEPYLSRLRETGVFQGGGEIGVGACFRRAGESPEPTAHLGGYIRVCAENLEQARTLLRGNPVFEAGGTVEIRELPRSS